MTNSSLSINRQDYDFTVAQWDELHDLVRGNVDVFNAICVEARRQSCDIEGVLRLADAYRNTRSRARSDHPIGKLEIQLIAQLVEPKTNGEYRRTGIYFANLNSGMPPELIDTAMSGLLDVINDDDIDIDAMIREFLIIHPFIDGNGRTAWLLRTWLRDDWDKPEPLPDYTF